MPTTTMPQQPASFDRAPPPAHPVAPGLHLELGDEVAFQYLCERQLTRCRRDGHALVVLRLDVALEARVDARLVEPLLDDCARRLRSRLRSSDTMARWQATRFGILLPRCGAVQAEAVMSRLTDAASGPYRLGTDLLGLQVRGALA